MMSHFEDDIVKITYTPLVFINGGNTLTIYDLKEYMDNNK